MFDFAQKIHDELVSKLESLDKSYNLETFSPDQRLGLIIATIERLKEKLKSYQFVDEEEEIRFFKSFMRLFLSLFTYYTERIDLESIQLLGSPKLREETFDRIYRRMDDFFKENAEFFRYYRSGKSNFDRYYFLRNSSMNQDTMDVLTPMMDPSFCTIYSFKVATILAYARLEQDIRQNFSDRRNEATAGLPDIKLKWTDPKMGLVELVYSLKEKGAFNNGKADLKSIAQYFEYVFSVSFSNITKSFQDILSRKTGYTNYIDKLRDLLANSIDRIEQNHIR